jgi:hypothetical protein
VIRSTNPNAKVGLYSMVPLGDFWVPNMYAYANRLAPTNSWWAAELPQATSDYKAWMAASAYLTPLAQKVDYIFPSLYTYYDPYSNGTDQDWQTFADQQIQAARMYGKPVYPFLWPEYHPSGSYSDYRYLPTDYWTNEIQYVQSHADGVVVWGWSGYQHESWNDQAPWWQAVLNLANSLTI